MNSGELKDKVKKSVLYSKAQVSLKKAEQFLFLLPGHYENDNQILSDEHIKIILKELDIKNLLIEQKENK